MSLEFSNREYYEIARVYIHSCENLEATCRRYRDESVPRLRTQGLRDPRFLSCDVREYLNIVYGDPWISHGKPVTSCDFYLWGEIKRRVYMDVPQNVQNLKDKIVSAFSEVKSDTKVLRRVNENMLKRAWLFGEKWIPFWTVIKVGTLNLVSISRIGLSFYYSCT